MTDVLLDGISDISVEDYMGNDLSVVRAARVSYAKDKGHEWKDSDAKLIQYMADHNHGTPFEHTAITFHVALPIFVIRQWHRHRIGWAYNEISRRYTSEDIMFYIPKPEEWRLQDTKNKQGSVEGELYAETRKLLTERITLLSQWAFDTYQQMIDSGVSREQARIILPQNLYTRMYATCNVRSAVHFIKLRKDAHAQPEIQAYARAMEEQLRELYPVSIAALLELS